MTPTLELTQSGRIDLDEVSALCRRGDEIVAVGDKAYDIVCNDVASLEDGWRSGDLSGLVTNDSEPDGSQWEGVAADGTGRILVLQEHAGRDRPSHVFVFAPG